MLDQVRFQFWFPVRKLLFVTASICFSFVAFMVCNDFDSFAGLGVSQFHVGLHFGFSYRFGLAVCWVLLWACVRLSQVPNWFRFLLLEFDEGCDCYRFDIPCYSFMPILLPLLQCHQHPHFQRFWFCLDHVTNRTRPMGITDEVNLHVNVLSASFPGHGHSQAFNAPDDLSLPKTLMRTLNQGSSSMSMDFHTRHAINQKSWF